MKKLLLISEPGSGGVKKNVLDIVSNIDHNIFQIYLIYGTSRADTDYVDTIKKYIQAYNLKAFEMKELKREINIKNDFISLLKIYKIILKIKPDIVHCHSSKAGVLGRITAKFAGVDKIIYTPHSYIFQNPNLKYLKKKCFILLEKFLTKYFTDMVINVSEDEYDLAKKCGFNGKKLRIIHNGIIIKNKNIKKINTENIVVSITRFDEQKNPFELVKIAEKVNHKRKDIKFYIAGNGKLFDVVHLYISDKKINNILLLGYLNNVEQVLVKGKLFLSSSLYESFPYALLEALASGLPVLTTNVIGNREVVKNNTAGWLYELGDIDAAAEIVCSVMDNKLAIDSQFLKRYVAENYDIKIMINKLQNVYLKTI